MGRKGQLVLFIVAFPSVLWLMEMLVRWMLDNEETATFLGPAVATAAVGLIGPITVPRESPFGWKQSERDQRLCYVGLWALLVSLVGWFFCLAIGMKHKVPAPFAYWMGPLAWQYAIAILLYLIGAVLTLMKEGE